MRIAVALAATGLAIAASGCPGGQTNVDDPGDSTNIPAWCERKLRVAATVSGSGFAAWLGSSGARNALIVRGQLSCPLIAAATESLVGHLAGCADQGPCEAPIAEADLTAIRAALAEAPARVVEVGGVEVTVRLAGEFSSADWPGEVSFDDLRSRFSFGQPPIGGAPAGGGTVRPGAGAPAPNVTAAGWRDCVAVPCLPNNCSGGREIDRDLTTIPIVDECDCPSVKPPCEPELASCSCHEDCCEPEGSAALDRSGGL